MPNDKKLQLKIVVNTEDVHVDANEEQPLHAVAQHALNSSQSKGRPLSDFDLKDASGTILDQSKKVADYQIQNNSVLYLTLKTGVTGTAP